MKNKEKIEVLRDALLNCLGTMHALNWHKAGGWKQKEYENTSATLKKTE